MTMKALTAVALLAVLASPALAKDEGGANAEQLSQPTPNRGSTSGGPSHGPDHPKNAPEGTAPSHTSKPHGHGDGSKH